ncbi:MAG: FkbM family methyltransferase [Candidatus Kapabacteria bacterium]|nr:FkbM family methyltransferase [Candidatus Kapabacteria bacterium]
MRLDITEFLQAHLYLFGSYELPTVRFIRSVLKPGDTAFDIGAQIGYLTLAMATAHPEPVRVVSFEPESHNLERLRSNIALNPGVNVSIVEKAASNVNGVLRLYLSHDHNSGTHSTIPNGVNVSNDFVEIPSVTLDTYLLDNQISNLRLIKIDVEGGELEVILGAERILRELCPIIVMEMSDSLQAAREFSTPEFKQMLALKGYRPYTINDNGTLKSSAVDASHAMENLAFVHDDHTASLRALISG